MCAIVTQVFVGIGDVYNSTLHIWDDKPIHSVVGSQNVFQLRQNTLRENRNYKARVQIIFHHVCSFVGVNTSIFYLSELYCSLVAQLLTRPLKIYLLLYFVDTFDTQNATVKPVTGGIHVKVEFIIGTFAMGSFITMQCQKTESDHYRPMDRNEISNVISLPYVDTGYKVSVYDLEQDGLPSTLPAITEEKVIFNKTDSPTGTCTVIHQLICMSVIMCYLLCKYYKRKTYVHVKEVVPKSVEVRKHVCSTEVLNTQHVYNAHMRKSLKARGLRF